MPGEIRWDGRHFAFLRRRVVLGCVMFFRKDSIGRTLGAGGSIEAGQCLECQDPLEKFLELAEDSSIEG